MTTTQVFWRSFFGFLLGPELVIAALAIVVVGIGWELWLRRARRKGRLPRKDRILEHAIAARLRKKAALGSSNSPSA